MERLPYRVDVTPDGRGQYGCPFCAFSRPDTASVLAHVQQGHTERGIYFIKTKPPEKRRAWRMAEKWPLKSDPLDYAKDNPSGKHADLARKIVAERKGQKGLRQTVWRSPATGEGHVNYECTFSRLNDNGDRVFCQFATLDKLDAEEHVRSHGLGAAGK